MKKALITIVLGAAYIAGSNLATANDERQWEGQISVEAPACDNNPWVRFRDNEYHIICGDYDFLHKGEEDYMGRFINHEIFPVGLEKWIDTDADGTADRWQMWDMPLGTTILNLTSTRAPPSAEDQQNYENGLASIGKNEIQSKWEEWRTGQ
ncbi:MAG: hypothetical protein PHO02_05645 [Candidatus Nanoarchaeia archaeon]|nr:hypothetical protein [Candidatus Nanoarchaeia archaeon]